VNVVTTEFLDYTLPPELIAQRPAARREDARLLVIERSSGAFHDSHFGQLARWLRGGDVLAVNETRVRPARLETVRESGARVELLIVRPDADGRWRALARPARRAAPGTTLTTRDGALVLEVTGAGMGGERLVRVRAGDLDQTLRSQGGVPLPPYIHRAPEPQDRERYQTVYARQEGAVAAPTAGLHFTHALLVALERAGIGHVPVVLHVGPGTFRPLSPGDPGGHVMDEEYYEVPSPTAAALRAARARGGRIVAVGTTTARALESACDANGGGLDAADGWTRKYILPPYRWQGVDALITNFHLPRTTLLLLVAAFSGGDLLRRAYEHAIERRYRFYSYGDAMLIL
jgi:S-adenosylmethionine:tRNA ribosyltransferase-isomerase